MISRPSIREDNGPCTPDDNPALVGKVVGSDDQVRPNIMREIRRALNCPVHCDCCGTAAPLQLDHCHRSGRLRGWVCRSCNTILGLIDAGRRMPRERERRYLARAGLFVVIPELPDSPESDEWLYVDDVAALLNVTRSLIEQSDIPYARVYSRRLLERWLGRRREHAE